MGNRFIIIPVDEISQLKLTPAETLVYGIIYGFTQGKTHKYFGSLKYIEEITGLHTVSVCRILQKLTEKGCIKKTVISTRKIEYTAVPIDELNPDDKIPVNASNLPTECETQSGVSNPITDKNKSICDEIDAINDKPPNQPTEYGNKMLAKIKASIQK